LNSRFRVERDSLGSIEVPVEAYYGAQTQRAVENFPVSGITLQRKFIRAQAIIKKAAAITHTFTGRLDKAKGEAIVEACSEILEGKFYDEFVVDVYQAGAGTSQNMNVNEVIANRANELLGGEKGDYSFVHPNDHVNMAQSTNDTIHVATHIAALEAIEKELIPVLEDLEEQLEIKAKEFDHILKSGRTHLQDAVPMRLGQEFGGYASMIRHGIRRVRNASNALRELNIGGTAVGTGLNAEPEYIRRVVKEISVLASVEFRNAENMFESTQNMDASVEVSGALKTLAVSLIKIANDLRLLSSGPNTGIAEIVLPPVQPGSSIMPGKVNPVMAEMLNMVAFQVIGNDATITLAGQAGQLELNVMMPVIAYNLIHSIEILTGGVRAFTERCVKGIEANEETCREYLERNPVVVTALSPYIGYDKAAEIAKKAYKERRTVRSIVLEMRLFSEEELEKILDLRRLTEPGVPAKE